jgi:hypothetical protein
LFWSCGTYAIDSGNGRIENEQLAADTSDVQTPPPPKPWDFGVTGGLLFSTIEGDLTETHSYVVGFSAGMYGITEIFYPLGLMVELYYAGLGTGFASIGDSKLHFNYLVLPVMFTYQFRPKFTLAVGPYFGFLLSAKDEGDDFKEDISELVNGLDVGVKIGIFYHLSEVVDFGVSFTRGFINTQSGDRVSEFKQYNQSVMFTTSINLTKILKQTR